MSVAQLEQELAGLQDDLGTIDDALALDDTDADALEMKPMLQEQVAELKARIAARKSEHRDAPPPPPPPTDDAPPPPPKFDMSKHPKFRKASPEALLPPAEDARIVFNSGDTVMAKYSADKQWYAATIVGKTGSSADPIYTVKFTGYAEKETKRKHEVRGTENKKRKADGAPAASAPQLQESPKPVQNGNVISAAPFIDPTLVQKREPSKVSDGPTRMAPAPKKLKGNKTLEKAKTSWNDWQKSGPKKPALGSASKKLGKESQFRTPDLPNAKVGFTGSGKPMSKDQARQKWSYGQEELDAD